jgi:hypothetical protein
MQRVERVMSFWPQMNTDETQMGKKGLYKESRKAGGTAKPRPLGLPFLPSCSPYKFLALLAVLHLCSSVAKSS